MCSSDLASQGKSKAFFWKSQQKARQKNKRERKEKSFYIFSQRITIFIKKNLIQVYDIYGKIEGERECFA